MRKNSAVFGGRPEQEVVATMGNPDDFSQAADARFLRYRPWWEQQGVTVYGAQGVIGGDPGGYAERYAEFTTRPDAQGEWRWTTSSSAETTRERGAQTELVCEDATRPSDIDGHRLAVRQGRPRIIHPANARRRESKHRKSEQRCDQDRGSGDWIP